MMFGQAVTKYHLFKRLVERISLSIERDQDGLTLRACYDLLGLAGTA